MTVSELINWVPGFLAVIGVGGAGALALRRRMSSDSTAIAADTQQRDWIERSAEQLERERERSERYRKELEALKDETALVKAENSRLRIERNRLRHDVESLGKRLKKFVSPEQRDALPTNFGEPDFESSGGQRRP